MLPAQGQQKEQTMANAYHNLGGWLRDVRSVLGDRTELADSYYWQLRDLLEEALQLCERRDDVTVAEDLEPTDDDMELADEQPGGRVQDGAPRGRPRESSASALGGSARMADALPRHVQAARERGEGWTPPVARAGLGVMRIDAKAAVVPDGFVPTGNRAVARPAPKRTRASKPSRGSKGRARGKK